MADRRNISQRVRFSTLHRFGFKCAYCGKASSETELVVDHIIPVAAGGDDSPANLAASCVDCNAGKSDLILQNSPSTPPLSRASRNWRPVPDMPLRAQDHSLWDREEAIAANLLRFIGINAIAS